MGSRQGLKNGQTHTDTLVTNRFHKYKIIERVSHVIRNRVPQKLLGINCLNLVKGGASGGESLMERLGWSVDNSRWLNL